MSDFDPTTVKSRIVGHRRVRAEDLEPHPVNWRRHPDGQESVLKKLLAEIGFADVLLAYPGPNGKLRLFDGHLRQELMQGGMVDVLETDLNEREARIMLRSLDPIASLAEPDEDILMDLIRQVDDPILEGLLAGTLGTTENTREQVREPGDEDLLPLSPPARTKPGDLWQMGNHRLLVADSSDSIAVKILFDGMPRAKLFLTDPPYAVDYDEKADDLAALGKIQGKMTHHRAIRHVPVNADGFDETMIVDLWRRAFETAYQEALDPAAAVYIWHSGRRPGTLLANILHEMGLLHHQTLIWTKENFVYGRCDYQWSHESIFYGWKRGHRPPFYGAKNQTTVWPCDRDTKTQHPTQKPTALSEPQILNHLKEGEVVYDPFIGSGTTYIAAEKHGRICLGCEIVPAHADVALMRYEDYTGEEAKLLWRNDENDAAAQEDRSPEKQSV